MGCSPHVYSSFAGFDARTLAQAKILDGNSHVRFHKAVLKKAEAKSTVRGIVHVLRHNT